MRIHEFTAHNSSAHGQFPGQDRRGEDLRQFTGAARACAPEHLQAFPAGAQSSSATHRSHRQRGERDTGVQVSVLGLFETGEPNR